MPHANRPPTAPEAMSTSPPASEVQAQIRRMLSRGALGESRRLSAMLEYLVAQTLCGNAARLKEYVIATEALGRPASFDPRSSAAVRVEANRLRHRLQAYYSGIGRDDLVRIELQPGRYVPRFTWTHDSATAHLSAPDLYGSTVVPSLSATAYPSIAVLPMTYLGESHRHRFVSSALGEELVASLSATGWLRVRTDASQTPAARSGRRARRDSRHGGASYSLGGSVISAGGRIRVFVQIEDDETGNVLLTHRHLQKTKDLLLDTGSVSRSIAPHLVRALATAERVRAATLSTDSLDAWSAYQLGNLHLYRFGRDDIQQARRCFQRSADADASFASPCGALAYAGFLDAVLGFDDRRDQVVADAVAAGRLAVRRDDRDPMAHFGLARALSLTGSLEGAMAELDAAIEIDPAFGPAHLGIGAALSLAGRHREAITALDTAIQLAPNDPILWTMENVRALSHLELGEFAQAVNYGTKACRHANTVPWAYLTLISALSNMERGAEARSVRAELLRRWPDFSMPHFAESNPFDRDTTPNWHRGIGVAWTLS